MTWGRYLDNRLPKQEQPNVLIYLFIQTLVSLKIINEDTRCPYVNEKGRVGNYLLYSSKVGNHLRMKWKKQGWYKFQSKINKGRTNDEIKEASIFS